MSRKILIEEVIKSTITENLFSTNIEFRDLLQNNLDTYLAFETNTIVSEIKDINGFSVGQVYFKNENDQDVVIEYTIKNQKYDI